MKLLDLVPMTLEYWAGGIFCISQMTHTIVNKKESTFHKQVSQASICAIVTMSRAPGKDVLSCKAWEPSLLLMWAFMQVQLRDRAST